MSVIALVPSPIAGAALGAVIAGPVGALAGWVGGCAVGVALVWWGTS